MSRAANLALSHLHCRRCAEETLHQSGICIHCGTAYEVVISPNLSLVQAMARTAEVNKARKARKHGTTKHTR